MKIEILDQSTTKEYDEFLNANKGTLIYQSSRYMHLLEQLLNCQQKTIILKNNVNKIIGALPLMEADGSLGIVINSLPFYGSNGGLIATEGAAREMIIEYYNEQVSQKNIAAATLIENPLAQNQSKLWRHEYIDKRIGQFTPLAYTENHDTELINSFHYKTRNMIRKAKKLGVSVSVENEQMNFLIKVHEENMREIGSEPKSKRFFELVQECFQPRIDYNIYVARLNKKAIAAVLVLYFNGVVEYFTPVIRKEERDRQGLSAAIYQAMIDASKRNFEWWNWGGTWLSQEGVYRFKSRWNTKDIMYHYFTTVQNKKILEMSRQVLRTEYESFYVIPFEMLRVRD